MAVPQIAPPGWALEEESKASRLRIEFARDFGVGRVKWSDHNISRFLRLTGECPARVAEMRGILGSLGVSVFDHREAWGRGRVPLFLVGHPYDVTPGGRALLDELARFGTLLVGVDDRPSYYGFGTHHVRVGLSEVRRPFKPLPSTPKTRSAARATRRAFAEEFELSREVNQ